MASLSSSRCTVHHRRLPQKSTIILIAVKKARARTRHKQNYYRTYHDERRDRHGFSPVYDVVESRKFRYPFSLAELWNLPVVSLSLRASCRMTRAREMLFRGGEPRTVFFLAEVIIIKNIAKCAKLQHQKGLHEDSNKYSSYISTMEIKQIDHSVASKLSESSVNFF